MEEKKQRLAVIVVLGVVFLAGVIKMEGGGYILGTLGCLFLLVLGLILLLGRNTRCPSCRKIFCLIIENETVVDRKQISVPVEAKIKNKAGEVTGTQEQYIPGERVTYKVHKVCKKCGHNVYSTYVKDKPYI